MPGSDKFTTISIALQKRKNITNMPFGVAMFVPINRKVLVYKRQEGLVMEEEIIEDRLITNSKQARKVCEMGEGLSRTP